MAARASRRPAIRGRQAAPPAHPNRAAVANSPVVVTYPGVRLVLTDPMPAEVVDAAHKRLSPAAEDLDANLVAALLLEFADEWG